MRHWLKSVYNSGDRSRAKDWRTLTWISDHHRQRGGRVTHRPGYQIGDQLFLYSVHDRVCPARFRVTAEPVYDPKRVNREGRRGDGRRWGWLTEVKLLAAVDLDRAPTLIELGVEPLSMRHRDHRRSRRTAITAPPRSSPTEWGVASAAPPDRSRSNKGSPMSSSNASRRRRDRRSAKNSGSCRPTRGHSRTTGAA